MQFSLLESEYKSCRFLEDSLQFRAITYTLCNGIKKSCNPLQFIAIPFQKHKSLISAFRRRSSQPQTGRSRFYLIWKGVCMGSGILGLIILILFVFEVKFTFFFISGHFATFLHNFWHRHRSALELGDN